MKPPAELTCKTVTHFSRLVTGVSQHMPGFAHRAVHGWDRFLLRLLRSYTLNYHSTNVPHSHEVSHNLLNHRHEELE